MTISSSARRPQWRVWWAEARWWIPRGRALPGDSWRVRHRAAVALVAAHVPLFAVWAAADGAPWWICLLSAAAPAAGAGLAMVDRLPRRVRSCIGAVSLMATSAIFVHLSKGLTESHFHFFVMIPVVALYEDWLPFGLAVAFVLVHHGVIGTTFPKLVYDQPAAWRHPWHYAFIHAVFFGAACLGALVSWRLQEISREKQEGLAARLLHQAHHDALTGLPNRVHLRERGHALLVERATDRRPVSVLLIDLDDFKDINDTLGHASGDVLLARMGPMLRSVVRPGDVMARLGGDEFAAVLADADEAAAVAIARRIIEIVSSPLDVDGVRLTVGASVGVAVGPPVGDIDMLLRRADVAMYTAKRARSGFAVYDPSQETTSRAKLTALGELRRAIDEGEIVLHYQPKLALDDGRVVGVEALARWQHPTRGLLPPASFVPLIDGSGLVVPFTMHVLDRALTQASTWQAAGHDFAVAVNISPRCLADPGMAPTVMSLLDLHGVPPHHLVLEITEQALALDGGTSLATLSALHASGVRFSVDDFGTGYSSLSRLGRLPVDEVKIDRSFIAGMLEDGEDAVLVRSMIELGHNLGLTVVAEGIEDQATADALAAGGCDTAQGYHLGRPMAVEDLDRWLRARGAGAPALPQQRAGERGIVRAS